MYISTCCVYKNKVEHIMGMKVILDIELEFFVYVLETKLILVMVVVKCNNMTSTTIVLNKIRVP